MALSLITYQHLSSDLMISCETPQDDGVIFTQQLLWHLNGGGNCVNGYFESLTHQSRPYKPTYSIYAVSECVCVYEWERGWWERKREGERGFFDPSESEEGIKLPVPLSEVTIPRSGVRFRLCHVEIPSSGLVCPSVFQRGCANSEPSPRRLRIPRDTCVEKSRSASEP